MNAKRTIWTVIFGAATLVGFRALQNTADPIPQLAGIGATGVILLFMAEPAPKLASGFAVLLGVALVFNLPIQTTQPEPVAPVTGPR